MADFKTVSSKGKEIFTDVTLHPGEVLDMELAARNIKKITFAEMLGVRPGHLSELLHGKRNVTASTALKLQKLLNISAEYWMRIQVYHDLFTERQKELEAA